ncbi:MAG: hypothetical protein ACOCTG_01790 [Bacteroidota bacterium]
MSRVVKDKGGFALWFALLGGGVAWITRFLVVWVTAEFGCISGVLQIGGLRSPVVVLTLVSVPFLVLAGYAAVVGWKLSRAYRDDIESDSAGTFMARAGMITSLLFVVIMIAEMVPLAFFMNECRSFSVLHLL